MLRQLCRLLPGGCVSVFLCAAPTLSVIGTPMDLACMAISWRAIGEKAGAGAGGPCMAVDGMEPDCIAGADVDWLGVVEPCMGVDCMAGAPPDWACIVVDCIVELCMGVGCIAASCMAGRG